MRCEQRNADPYRMYENYYKIYTTIKDLRDECGMLDATNEFTKHVETMALEKLWYTGQYKRNEFGRGKLAEQ